MGSMWILSRGDPLRVSESQTTLEQLRGGPGAPDMVTGQPLVCLDCLATKFSVCSCQTLWTRADETGFSVTAVDTTADSRGKGDGVLRMWQRETSSRQP
jgi:hypothetical protein